MPLKSIVNEPGVRPTNPTVNAIFTSFLRFIAVQESNNDYLEGLTLLSGITTSDANKSIVVDPSGASTTLSAVDQRTRIRLQDVLSVSGNTGASDSQVTATLGSTGAGILKTVGKTGSAVAAKATLTQLGTASTAGAANFTFGDTEFDDHADATITIIDTAGTSKTYTIKASGATASSQQFNDGANASEAAANFVALGNSSNGHNGTIVYSAIGSQVTMVQSVVGSLGNKSVSVSNFNNVCDVNPPSAFSGGTSIGTSLSGKTVILADAAGTSHTLTYSSSSATSATLIGCAPLTYTTAIQIAGQLTAAVNAANTASSIAMTAVDNGNGTVTLTMAGTGTAGNGDKVTGTAESNSVITATNFAGGSAGPQFSVITQGNTGTDSGITVSDADTVSMTATNISLTGNTGLTLNKATIASLVYPIIDGSANHVLKTDGSGNLAFADMRQFTVAATGASNTVYLNSYLPNTGGQLALAPETSSSSATLPGYSFNGKLSTGFGAKLDSTSKAHNLYLKFNNDYAMRLTNTSSGDILHLGNDATEFNAGTYVLVKPSMKGTNSWPSANSDRAGAIFYDGTNSKLHYYTAAAVKEVATVDAITSLLATAGGTLTGQVILNPGTSAAATGSLDLRFNNANNSGFYGKTAENKSSPNKALAFAYNGAAVFEFTAEGIAGSTAANSYAPFLLYGNGSVSSAPAYTFTSDTDTGMYRSAANTISFTTGGTRRASISSAGWDFASQVIYNVPTPSAASHAVNKSYMDGVIAAGSTANAITAYSGNSKYEQVPAVLVPSSSGNQWIEVGTASSATGRLTLKHASHAYSTTIQPGSISGNLTFTLPTADGANATIMTTNGSGQLAFQTLAALGDGRYVQPGAAVFTSTAQTITGKALTPAIRFGAGSVGMYRNTGQAYVSFRFGDTEFDDHVDETITIIDTAALSKTYTIKASSASAGSQQFNRGASASACAINIVALINGANGHNGTILAEANTITAGDVRLTQATGGSAGNTVVAHTSNWDALCDVNPGAAFVGGDSDDSIVYQTDAYTPVAAFKTSNCAGTRKPSVQGLDSKSARMVTDPRDNGGPLFTFVGAEDTGVGYSGTAPVAATATFTFGVTSFDDQNNQTITLLNTAGLSKVYKVKNGNDASADTTQREFNVGGTATVCATNFCAIVNHVDGHNGTIIASSAGAVVTLTQSVAGTAGHTSIAHTASWDAICDVNVGSTFTGGSQGTSILNLCADNSSTPAVQIKAADVTLNSIKIKGLATPTASTDASTKGYVDAVGAAIIAPSVAGSAVGQMMTHNTSSGKPAFNADLVYTADELKIGNTGGAGTSSSLKVSTKYQYIELAAPLATAASGTGAIAPYTLTLPLSVGNTKDVMVASDANGALKFERRGAYLVQCTYTINASAAPSWHDYRHDMQLILGSSPALTVTSGKTAPGGFSASVAATGNTNVRVGSSTTYFQQQPAFVVWINGVEQSKGNNVTWVSNSVIKLRTRVKTGDIVTVQGMESADITNMGF